MADTDGHHDEMASESEPKRPSNDVSSTEPEMKAVAAAAEGEPSTRVPFNPGWRFYCLFWVLSGCTMVSALDANIVAVALPIISHDLNGTALETFWLGTSFLLTSCVLQPAIFALSNVFGRKPIFLIILVFFSVGTIVGALARNMTVLLLARCIQGVGGGGIHALCNIIVTDTVPLRERGKWFGFMAGTWAIASVTGRWIFWILLPLCAIGLIGLPIFLRLEKRPGSFFFKLAQIDWIGAILLTASVTSFLMPISWGGVMFPWDSWRTLLPLLLGLAGIAGFVLYEHFVASKPLIKLRIFKTRTAAVNYVGTVIHGCILWCMLFYLPLYYEGVKGYSATMTGVAIFPETFTVAPVVIIVGILVSVVGRYRWAIWGGWTITTLGLGILCLLRPETTIPQFVFLNLVPGIGAGMLFASTEYAIQAAVAEEDSGMAVTMFAFSRTLGQSIGVAVGGVVFQSRLRTELLKAPAFKDTAVAWSRDASALVHLIKSMDAADPAGERRLLVDAYATALQSVWAVMAGLAGLALLLSLLTKELSIDRDLGGEQAFIHDEKDGKGSE